MAYGTPIFRQRAGSQTTSSIGSTSCAITTNCAFPCSSTSNNSPSGPCTLQCQWKAHLKANLTWHLLKPEPWNCIKKIRTRCVGDSKGVKPVQSGRSHDWVHTSQQSASWSLLFCPRFQPSPCWEGVPSWQLCPLAGTSTASWTSWLLLIASFQSLAFNKY